MLLLNALKYSRTTEKEVIIKLTTMKTHCERYNVNKWVHSDPVSPVGVNVSNPNNSTSTKRKKKEKNTVVPYFLFFLKKVFGWFSLFYFVFFLQDILNDFVLSEMLFPG